MHYHDFIFIQTYFKIALKIKGFQLCFNENLKHRTLIWINFYEHFIKCGLNNDYLNFFLFKIFVNFF